MFQKTASRGILLLFLGGGELLSITAIALQAVLTQESLIKRVLLYMNWPVYQAVDWYALVFYGGNTDQLILPMVVVWGIYWLTLGAVVGLVGYGLWRCFAKD